MVKIYKFLFLLLPMIFIISGCNNKKPENTIVEYGDFKCSYCKDVEDNIMPKLKKQYIDTNKADYKFKNVATLGLDSIIGARAGNAVEMYAPDEYLKFQKLMFDNQPSNAKNWITTKLVNKQINNLDVEEGIKEKIKKEYNRADSKPADKITKDNEQAKKHKIKTVPTVFINGKEVKDPHDYKEYEKLLKN
ncbi:DsbA family protein [Staphylococcus equorum]|uniref:DsbA family protein n=1 Tax=Staphylococcus equorum TaxID=246432 RepID=UPI003CF9EC95